MIVVYFKLLIILLFFALSLVISTLVIKKVLPLFPRRPEQDSFSLTLHPWFGDQGFWIGFFETLIIFVFVAYGEFAGLAIIFAAKEYVRKEEIKKDPVYYLLGTLVNFGIALLMAVLAYNLNALTF